MKLLFIAIFISASFCSEAQYYYKDIIGSAQTADLIRTYKNNKVSKVLVTSYDGENTKIDDFFVEQQFSQDALKTITRSNISNESILISYIDGSNHVIKTVDSSDIAASYTTYSYNADGTLASTASFSQDSGKTTSETERHIWQYENKKPVSMQRIKNGNDTIFVQFKLDDRGNVSEEKEIHKGLSSQPVYYYYDDNGRLTDIVTFSKRAKRLLPEYMFEYSPSNQVLQQITVPENSSEYTIWRYQYDDKGLKIKEAIYNKQKQLTGKLEYQYSFSS
jgi:hypothetical protein